MQRKKVTRATLAELAQRKEIIAFEMQKTFVGCGDGTYGNPFTFDEFQRFGGGSNIYYYNESGELCCNLPEITVTGGTNTSYDGGTSSNGNIGGYQGGSYSGGTNTVTYSTLTPEQFKGYQKNDSDGCLRRCDEMLREAGVSRSGQQIKMTNQTGDGRAGSATSQSQSGIDAINSSLANGKPIVVCVDYRNGTSSGDQQGDHFIVITGSTTITNSDGSSTTTYNFYDPATGNQNYGTSSNNTLTVNDGKLTGSFEKTNGRTNNYTVTSVRTNK